ncbi:alpha/beta fold hydrolase [Aspergillus lucknowensis]|uniref:Alpha/beta-hydrolase n=1 Tax=Aspergillus lucknowensis TaxID=176173 RepID=A0ABR4LE31_9EURO
MDSCTVQASKLDALMPPSINSRIVPTKTLSFHILEAGYTASHDRPLILLLHGFPELAFSWRKVLSPLADAGYYVVAPDQRGFGRTTGWDTRPFDDVDLTSFSSTSFVRDIVILVHALGYQSVRCVVGHDLGAATAAMCALVRPDVFRSVVLVSQPFNEVPGLPFTTASHTNTDCSTLNEGDRAASEFAAGGDVHSELAALGRKHYRWYYSTASANNDMMNSPNGLHDFLRGYFHLKSGSWTCNKPYPLRRWTATELAQLPYYYIMPVECTMPEAVARYMENESEAQVNRSHDWLPDEDLAVYVSEYSRTGFQGGLNWYRVRTAAGGRYMRDTDVYAGKKISVPTSFVLANRDWGVYQDPGALEKMIDGTVCSDFRELRYVDGVGHWVPQEKPEAIVDAILDLIQGVQSS